MATALELFGEFEGEDFVLFGEFEGADFGLFGEFEGADFVLYGEIDQVELLITDVAGPEYIITDQGEKIEV